MSFKGINGVEPVTSMFRTLRPDSLGSSEVLKDYGLRYF